MVGGAGGNRTPVRFGSIVRDTTIPVFVVYGTHAVGSVGSYDLAASSFSGVSSLSYSQRSFPAVHHYFCCQAVVVRPRESLLVPMTLKRLKIRRQERHENCRVLFAPFWSLSNSGRTIRRNNRHVETDQPLVKQLFRKASSETHQIITIAGNCDTITKEDNLD